MDAIASRFDPAVNPDDDDGYRGRLALVAGQRSYTWPRFRRTVFRTGNLLRHHGVHDGSTVVLLPDTAPEPIFVLLGTWLLGGRVGFDPSRNTEQAVLVGPTDALPAADPPGVKSVVGYGRPPSDPTRSYFEGEMWSENPTFPPIETGDEETMFHQPIPWTRGAVIDAARRMAEWVDSTPTVALREPIEVKSAIAGVVHPLLARATILLPTEDQTGDVAVASGPAPEPTRFDPQSIHHPRVEE